MISVSPAKALLVTALIGPAALVGCSADPQEAYCARVSAHQETLTEVAASQEDDALFDALPSYRDLAAHAPRDVEDEWQRVVTSLQALEEAVRSGDDAEVQAASAQLGSRQTVEAMAALEQHALDVCGTPLAR